MMNFVIEPAEITQSKAKVALVGPAGAGKTYTALTIAQELGDNILVIDTENKSSTKYANKFKFNLLPVPNYELKTYIAALEFAAQQKFDVVIVDSLSHAWAGKGGALEQADLAGNSKYGGNKFAGWADVTPLQNRLIETILNYPTHLIATMRMKIEYALVTDSNGKTKPQKLGLGIVQRDSFEYEFDILAQMDVEHNLVVTKTRCFELDGYMAAKPGPELGQIIGRWLSSGQAATYGKFTTHDELLFQLNLDFGLKEDEAKAKIKELGLSTKGIGNGELSRRLSEIYEAVKANL